MLKWILFASVALMTGRALAACTDFSGKYVRAQGNFRMTWKQNGCESLTVTEGENTVEFLTDGQFRRSTPESALKAFMFVNEKLVYSYVGLDLRSKMTMIFSKNGQGQLLADTMWCGDTQCTHMFDLYTPIQ